MEQVVKYTVLKSKVYGPCKVYGLALKVYGPDVKYTVFGVNYTVQDEKYTVLCLNYTVHGEKYTVQVFDPMSHVL